MSINDDKERINRINKWADWIAEEGRNGNLSPQEAFHHLLGMRNALSVLWMYQECQTYIASLREEFAESYRQTVRERRAQRKDR